MFSLSFSQSQINKVINNKYLLLNDGSLYEITSYVGYQYWSPYSFVDIIDDIKMIYKDEEYYISKIEGSQYQIDEVFNDNYILFNDGSLYEITSYVGYKNWSSYDDVYIIDDKKMLYDDEEYTVERVNEKNIERTNIRRVSEDLPYYISLVNGKTYFTIDVKPGIWLDYSRVIVIEQEYMIHTSLDHIISVTRVR